MKIIFMGSPEFAVPSFKKLIKSGHEITSCWTREPAQKNRGKKIIPTPVQILAEENDIAVFTPKTLRDEKLVAELKKQEPDFLVVVAYGMILPKEILEIPKYECLNLHPSALPRFRGAAPLQRTLMVGDTETEVCIMKMSEGLDEGDVYLKESFKINDELSLGELHDATAEIGARLMLEVIDNFENLSATPQKSDGVLYAPKISKKEAEIDFKKSGDEIINLIRGLNPFPGAFMMEGQNRIKIYSASFKIEKHGEKPGKINEGFQIFCKDGIIIPKILQKPGKTKVTLEEFLKSYNI